MRVVRCILRFVEVGLGCLIAWLLGCLVGMCVFCVCGDFIKSKSGMGEGVLDMKVGNLS